MRIFGGIILVIIGALITVYSEKIFTTFGSVAFAEKYLGAEGGSRLFYKLLGILIIVLGVMIMTNMFGPLFMSLFGSLFSGLAPQQPI